MESKNKKLDDIQLRSEEVQEILTRVPHWLIRWGNVLFLLLMLLILGLAWMIRYPDVIRAEATITTTVPPQKLIANSTGQIQKLLVKNGASVASGEILAILQNTAKYEDVYELKSLLDSVTINQHAMQFPLEQLPIFSLGEIESSYAIFENSYLQYLIYRDLQPLSYEVVTNAYALEELQARLASMQYQQELAHSELGFKKNEMKRNQQLFDEGVISEQQYENIKLTYLQTQRSYENMRITISQLKESINSAQKKAKTIDISKREQELTSVRKVVQAYNQLVKSIRDWELRYVIKSDINGRIAYLNHWHENTSVHQGDLLFSIIPAENSAFIARLKSPARNAGKIRLGQPVNIRLENYPEEEFGTLPATISHISLVPDLEGLYLVDAKLPTDLITSYKKKLDFRQEMQGSAEIITDNLRLIDRLFGKFKQIFS